MPPSYQPRNAAPPGTFSTSDLYFAAYLKTADIPMVSHNREYNKVLFVFNTAAVNIDELRQAWIDETGKVSASKYATSVRMLKGLVHLV